MSNTADTSANAAPKGAATAQPGLTTFILRFQDWTAYRLIVKAASEDEAIAKAQAMCTAELWEAEAIDGGQEGFEALPAPDQSKGGVS